jgi:glycerol-3-phosphate O-acyltransferase
LLNYLAAAVRRNRVDDVMLVPVSITYERLNELGAIAHEQVGGKKKPEGLAWLARYVRSQQHSAGHVYVRFGEPLSARDRLAAHGDPLTEPPASIPLHGTDDRGVDSVSEPDAETAELERKAVQRLAFEIAVGINTVTPITVNALATLALLGVHDRALTLGEVRAVLDPVLRYIDKRGLPSGKLAALRDEQSLAVVLEQLSLAKVVTIYRGGLEPVYSIEPGAHLEAAFYRNSGVHWFLNRSLLELAALAAAEQPTTASAEQGIIEADQLRDLLKYEFFFPDRDTFHRQMLAELETVAPQWRQEAPTALELLDRLTASGFMMVHRTLRSFFDAQLVVAERLVLREPGDLVDRKELVRECVGVGRQMLLQNRLHSPESVSSELFNNAIKLADNRHLLGPGDEELRARRIEFAEDLLAISERITRAASLDPSNRRIFRGIR